MKTKYLIYAIVFFLFSSFSFSQSKQLSNQAQVSLITYGTGEEVYSVFGHSAIRVYDPENDIDWTYNYGTFDFGTSNFYIKFVRGNLNYFLTISDFNRAKYFYIKENRFIDEMVLNFKSEQKQKLFDDLTENYKPENRSYQYDFFFDNCATRIRDMIINASCVKYEFEKDEKFDNLSFRNLLEAYIQHSPWLDFGINLALGLPSDEKAKVWGSMYIPDYLKAGFKNAKILINNEFVQYIANEKLHFKEKEIEEKRSHTLFRVLTPMVIFTIFLMLAIIVSFLENRITFKSLWFDKILFGFTGILGFVILLLWVGTEHDVMNNNLNILWAMPLNIFIFWSYKKVSYDKIIACYLLIYSLLLVAILMFWKIIPQELHISLIPLIIALLIRSLLKSAKGIKAIVS